ncbi:unnamed protein product [Spodoptera exigua]|nr:unnamed protein product [Spodoptera exigua]
MSKTGGSRSRLAPNPTEQSVSSDKITESMPMGASSDRLQHSSPKFPSRRSKILRELANDSKESSHTKYYKKTREKKEFEQTTRQEFLSSSESLSGSSDTFGCIHGPQGKEYSAKGLLKRNIVKNLDPIPTDPKWSADCISSLKWAVAQKLEDLVSYPTVEQQIGRLQELLNNSRLPVRKDVLCAVIHIIIEALVNKLCMSYQRVDTLGNLCSILKYLLEAVVQFPCLKPELVSLLKNFNGPILLMKASDVVTYFDKIKQFIGFMGYLLIELQDGDLLDVVAAALLWHLSAPDTIRGQATVQLRHSMAAAAPVLLQSTVRMIAIAEPRRFAIFLEIALLLAFDTAENCIEMMKENILENLFYRFNPYFPERKLESYDISPLDCHDPNVKLGESTVNITTTMTILLVLLKTTKDYLDKNPKLGALLPCPDCCAQRCFIWAYRYECRAREHRHERITLTVIAAALIKCFGERLFLFSSVLMADIVSLSVLTELPPRDDWTATVHFTTAQQDVQFKKLLINFVVDLLKTFPYNKFMLQSRYWFVGIMSLVDPGLSSLRAHWSPPLFAELRKTALQALVCTIPLTDPKCVKEYGLIRRIMWYIEWYSENPYEISILYWCVRLLQAAIHLTRKPERDRAIRDLFDTHGIVILIHLCHTLMEQKLPIVEKSQAVLALSLQLLTSSVHVKQKLSCCVYPDIKWPVCVNFLARKMVDVVLYSLDQNFIISDRWLVSLFNFIWEAIIWTPEYRTHFVATDGIYKLLDIITMTRPAVQCIALAVVCDIARAGGAVGHLVSWRANLRASKAVTLESDQELRNPNVVARGATIASLLAAVFREGCRSTGVKLDEYGVLQNLDNPIMSEDVREELQNTDVFYGISHSLPFCLTAQDMAGSCMSKVILVLCSHYLTLKLNEVWSETKVQCVDMITKDNEILEDFLAVGKGWAKEIKRQQEEVIARDRKKEKEEERSLYAFLSRIRLNIALDALHAVRCVARSTDRARITHAMLQDAVLAHHRRSLLAENNNTTLLRTYKSPLDDQNMTGQNVKVNSICPKHIRKSLELNMGEKIVEKK